MQEHPRRSSDGPKKHSAEVHELSADSPASTSPASSGAELLATSARGVFDASGVEQFYKPIDTYEGIHRYDPDFQWDAKEEKRVVRKLDLRICSWVCFAFFALQLDRSNITQVCPSRSTLA